MTMFVSSLGNRFAEILPHADELWAALEARMAEMDDLELPNFGGITQEAPTTDGFWLSAIYEIGQRDGSRKILRFRACWDGDRPQVDVNTWFHNYECFWEQLIRDTPPEKRVVVDHEHYIIGDETQAGPKGYGGRRFVIEFQDGRRVTTHNLWHQGVIPPVFRHRLPDNARFADSFSQDMP